MATITMAPAATGFANEHIDRSTDTIANGGAGFSDTAGDIGDADGYNRYIPMLYAKKVLFDFYRSTVFKEVTNTDYEGQFKSMGDSIQIRQAPNTGDPTAYLKGKAIDYTTPAKNAQNMVIDKAFYQAFHVDDVDKVQTDVGLMDMYIQDARERMVIYTDYTVLAGMANAVDTDVALGASGFLNGGATAGKISGAYNLGVDTVAGAIGIDRSNALDKLVDLSSALSENNITGADRWVIIPEWYANRLKLSDLKAADFSGDSTGVVRTGMIGSINGMKVYVSNNTGGADGTNAKAVLAGHKFATSFALQMSQVDSLTAEGTFGQKWRTLWVWGMKVVRAEGLALLYCNPA
jgi:hypothetical protein